MLFLLLASKKTFFFKKSAFSYSKRMVDVGLMVEMI